MQKKSMNWINSFKGLAICGIVLIHSGAANLPSVLGKAGAIGNSGVQIFYLISGYLAFLSMDNFVKKEGEESFKWVRKKILRLLPLFYIALIVGCLIGGDSYWYGCDEKVTIPNIITHFLFLHGFFPRYANSIIGGEWYLGTLVLFYLVVPLLHKYLDCLEKVIVFLSGITIGGTYITKILLRLVDGMIAEDKYIYASYVGTFSFFAQFSVFVLGILLYFLFKEINFENIKYKKMISCVMLFFSMLMLGGEIVKSNNLLGISGVMLFALWYSGMIISQQIYSCGLLKAGGVLPSLGKYSYGIYLFHFFIIKFYDKYISLNIGNEITTWFVKFIICFCLSYIVSFVLTKCIDEPVNKYLRRKLK